MAQIYYSGPNRQPVIVDDSALPGLLQSGALTPATLVWMEGMADWKPLREVRPDLAAAAAGGVSPVLPAVPSSPSYAAPGTQQKSHDVDFTLIGEEMQIIEIELDPGETVIAEAGSMNYMDPTIKFETKMGDGSNPKSGFWDKVKQVGKRMLTGESLFMTHFTNQGGGKSRVAFAAPYPGKIIPLELKHYNGEIICQKDAFLCAAMGTKVGIAFAQKLGVGLFGGEGFILQKLNGDGRAFIHVGGTVVKKELRGETVL
ncbi:MAG TPA: AIM24 family protein, partial [Verrucomicrobiales bacterium]|nr:AIM24 family protein [Verrucomicrobiales bacterium]